MVIDGHCLECDGNGYHVEDCPHRTYFERLKAAQAVENNNTGITCVKSMLTYLERGQKTLAANIWHIDGDKIRSYPEVEKLCKEIFGCRLHLMIACDKCIT